MSVEPDMPSLMLFMGRIMVPERAKARVKEALHLAHLGETKMLALARSLYHWPGMVKDLKNMVWACEPCEKYRISKPAEPLVQTLDAWRPFQQVSVDLAQLEGKHYLVLADRYSGWPEVKQLAHLDTHSITKTLEEIFETFGIPERIRSNGGPQFRQDFENWCQDLGMVHELTSPYHPEANGHAEQAVGAMKKLLKKTGSRRQLGEALLEYRDAPRVGDELSPTQWMFGRRQRTRAPAPKQQRITNAQLTTHMRKRLENAEKVKENEPKLASPEFKLDDRVVVQHPKVWDTHGHITRKLTRRRCRRQANAGLLGPGKFIKLRAAHEPPTTTSWTPKPPWSPKPAQARRESSKRTRKKPSRYLDRSESTQRRSRAIGSRIMKFRSSPPDVATPKLGGM